ncbi:imidazoleglycerol-phosphate dehydratase HisB [Selenomonadales bacterium OttesenSCG-928-I06]|nr:imidazoleglycerol-phosphate dehydratase HisB [Selenomonadales bacterium OttesenSCG-928-I06]
MNRISSLERKTLETDIKLSINLDGTGVSSINTGVGFFDHMLTLFAKHGLFDLNLSCSGDLNVDFHHTVEDVGIVLGQAFKEALGDKNSIRRYGSSFVPMDEALAHSIVDLSGRPFLAFNSDLNIARTGDFDFELVEEFVRAFCVQAGITAHIRILEGKNTHHVIEAVFKSLTRALSEAVSINSRINGVMSTKGSLN